MNALSTAALFVVFLIPFVPLIKRPGAAYRLHRRLLRILGSMDAEAVSRGKSSNERYQDLRDSLITVAGIAPVIAAGMVARAPRADMTEAGANSAQMEMQAYVEDNAWLMPFLGAYVCCVELLEFYGHPFRPTRWKHALLSSVVLRFSMRIDGGVWCVTDAQRTARSYEKTLRLAEREQQAVLNYGPRHRGPHVTVG